MLRFIRPDFVLEPVFSPMLSNIETAPHSSSHRRLTSLPSDSQDFFMEANVRSFGGTSNSHVAESQKSRFNSCSSSMVLPNSLVTPSTPNISSVEGSETSPLSTVRKYNEELHFLNGHSSPWMEESPTRFLTKPDADGSPGTIAAKAFRRSAGTLQLEHGNLSSLSFQASPSQTARRRSHSHTGHSKSRKTSGDSVAHCAKHTHDRFVDSELAYQLAYDGIQQAPANTTDQDSTDGTNASENPEHPFFREIMDSRRNTSATLCDPLSPIQKTRTPEGRNVMLEAATAACSPITSQTHAQSLIFDPFQLQDPKRPPPTQSSNYVRISRRTRGPPLPEPPKKPMTSFLRLFSASKTRPSTHSSHRRSSWITGSFTIDPRLCVPSGILSTKGSIDFATSARKNTSTITPKSGIGNSGEKKNLLLEVENGGIDVSIRLVPDSSLEGPKHVDCASPKYTTIDLRLLAPGERSGLTKTPETGRNSQKQKSSKNKPKFTDAFPLIARIDAPIPRPPIYLFASTVSQNSNPSTPTAGHQRTAENSKVNSTQAAPQVASSLDDTVTLSRSSTATKRLSKSTARPYHLPSSLVTAQEPPPLSQQDHCAAPSCQACHQASAPSTCLPPASNNSRRCYDPSSLQSQSPILLHLPRSFRGPLTVSVLGVVEHGGVGGHVRLSLEVQNQAVLLQETDDRQVYFLGGLKEEPDEINKDLEAPCICPAKMTTGGTMGDGDTIKFKMSSAEGSPEPCSGVKRASGSTDVKCKKGGDNSSCPTSTSPWQGDRIDLVVGQGMVDLRYTGE